MDGINTDKRHSMYLLRSTIYGYDEKVQKVKN